MEEILIFGKNISLYSLIDLGFVLALMILLGVFFAKKRNFRNAIMYYTFIILYLGVAVGYFFMQGKILFVALQVCKFFAIFLICAFCVVYQTDLKKIFARIGHDRGDDDAYAGKKNSADELVKASSEIVKACQHMSKNDIGALIIVCPTSIPTNIVETGTRLDCLLSSQVLESIFNGKSPLHDGAVIVKGSYIVAAGCFLPLSENPTLDKNLGTRHRAAVGISEQSDVLSVVVSEESGIISTVKRGKIKRYITSEKLYDSLSDAYGIVDLKTSRPNPPTGKRF